MQGGRTEILNTDFSKSAPFKSWAQQRSIVVAASSQGRLEHGLCVDRYWPGASQESETESLGKFHCNDFGFNSARHAPELDKLVSLKLQVLILFWN